MKVYRVQIALCLMLFPLCAFANYSTSLSSSSVYDATASCSSIQCWIGLSSSPVMSEVSAAEDGTIYGVDTSRSIWRLPLGTRVWQSTALSPMTHISVAAANNIWGLRAGTCTSPDVNLYHYTGGVDFNLVSGHCFVQVSAASDGTAWGVRSDGAIFSRNANGTWSAIFGATGNGRVVKAAVGSKSFIWVITATKVIKVYNPGTGSFSIVPGAATDIDASSSDQAWIVGNTVNGSNLYWFNLQTDAWTPVIGYASKITSGGSLYTLVVQNGTVYHFNSVGLRATATIQGSYDCPPGPGCPTGSYHTITAKVHFGSHADSAGSTSGFPSSYISASAQATTNDCDPIFSSSSDPACQLVFSGCGDCSVMGYLGCFQGGTTGLELAFTNVYWNGPTPSCTTDMFGITHCQYLVHNNCTAATTPPDNNLENTLLGEPYRPATYLDWTVLAGCFRFLPGTPWSCSHGAAFLTGINTPVPPYSCTHNP